MKYNFHHYLNYVNVFGNLKEFYYEDILNVKTHNGDNFENYFNWYSEPVPSVSRDYLDNYSDESFQLVTTSLILSIYQPPGMDWIIN